MDIRPATPNDMPAIQAIFAQEVLTGTATFEETPPNVDAISDRWRTLTDAGFPYIVAERGGAVAGYALAGPYRPRPAYRFSIEHSVYVAADSRGAGVGRALMQSLVTSAQSGPWHQMVAVIGDSENAASIALHRRCGFEHRGTLVAVGHKFNRWIDTVIMQLDVSQS